jgi:hypothetical protein
MLSEGTPAGAARAPENSAGDVTAPRASPRCYFLSEGLLGFFAGAAGVFLPHPQPMEHAPFIGDGSPTPTRIARLPPMSRFAAVDARSLLWIR